MYATETAGVAQTFLRQKSQENLRDLYRSRILTVFNEDLLLRSKKRGFSIHDSVLIRFGNVADVRYKAPSVVKKEEQLTHHWILK